MQNHSALALWNWMLITACWQKRSFCSKGVRVDLSEGQLLYSRSLVLKQVGLSHQKGRTAFAYLVKSNRITSVSTNKGTIVTICNWHLYQLGEDEGNQQTKPRVTHAQPMGNHSKEVVEVEALKNKNKTVTTTKISWTQESSWAGITEKDMAGWREAYPACDIERLLLAMQEWLISNPVRSKKSNWRKFITTWLSKEQDSGGEHRGHSYAKPNTQRQTRASKEHDENITIPNIQASL